MKRVTDAQSANSLLFSRIFTGYIIEGNLLIVLERGVIMLKKKEIDKTLGIVMTELGLIDKSKLDDVTRVYVEDAIDNILRLRKEHFGYPSLK